MKNIQSFSPEKYQGTLYTPVEEGIYRLDQDGGTLYVTTLSFVQEPDLGEGPHAGEISQYPLEDILDQFYCHISDFCESLNQSGSPVCYQEFAAPDLEDVRKLRGIIGKHVYNKEIDGYIQLIIE